jgi:CBS domain-containing protein
MLVAMWMMENPATIRPTTTIADAAVEMSRRHFRHVLVTVGAPRAERRTHLRSP